MKVIILAAGRGSRMGKQTEDKPKCLSLVNGKTLLERALDASRSILKEKDIIVIGGYRREMLAQFSSNTMFNPDWASTNIMGSLLVADDFLKSEDCLVLYSDILFDAQDLRALFEAKEPSVLSVGDWESIWRRRFNQPLDDLEKFKFDPVSGLLLDIGGSSSSLIDIQGQFAGMWRTTPEFWPILKGLKGLEQMDTTTAMRLSLERGAKIKVIFGRGSWFEFDHISDFDALD